MTLPAPQFPIYIPSRSRFDSRFTMRALETIGITDYTVIVEDDQFDDYATAMGGEEHLLRLDPRFQDEYDPCDDLGRSKRLGSGPARNMAWEHALARGATWHWIMDDNIKCWFWRISGGHKTYVTDAAPILMMEDFAVRWRNIAMLGPNYEYFAPARYEIPPFITGTRIYSCNLIRNAVPIRWRCRLNEDTDLSLRMLKAGWNTVLFNAFLQWKAPTTTVQGGNTEAFYGPDGTLAKSAMLARLHPDCTRISRKFGRVHHHVDYSAWRNRPLLPDPDAPPPVRWQSVGHETGNSFTHVAAR